MALGTAGNYQVRISSTLCELVLCLADLGFPHFPTCPDFFQMHFFLDRFICSESPS